MLVQPDDRFTERRLTFSVRPSSERDLFVLAVCNVGAPVDLAPIHIAAHEVAFRYLIVDLP